MTGIQASGKVMGWSGGGAEGPTLQKACATNFYKRNLGNSYMQSLENSHPATGYMAAGGGAPAIQRKCNCGGSCESCAGKEDETGKIQTKLAIGAPDDVYEQEAERVADQVMRMSETSESPEQEGMFAVRHQSDSGEIVQRLGAQSSPSLADTIVVEEEKPEQGTVQTLRPQNQQSGREEVSRQRLNVSQGGMPIVSNARRFMEARFGADFSQVRIHAGNDAGALSESLNARAFTHGLNIYFGNNEYKPDTRDGKHILAHELTHVVQQGASQVGVPVMQNLTTNHCPDSPMKIQRLSALGRALRHNVAPWGPGGPTGTDYEVTTDSSSTVTGWKAYSPWQVPLQYWCHGHSTNSFVDYGYSVYSGSDFSQVVTDEWTNIAPAQTRAGDIAVWTAGMDHSAKFTDPVIENGQLSAGKSMLSTKNGQNPVAPMTLTAIAGMYGGAGVAVYRHK